MSKRVLTREERAYRKARAVYLLVVVAWIVLVFVIFSVSKQNADAGEQPEPPAVSIAPEPEPTPQPKPEKPKFDPELEVEPKESSPVREDIPLDAETQTLLYQACDETGVQYELALAVVWKETRFQNLTGDNGDSIGYMQIKQRWHEERMERLGVTDLTDPYGNFIVGCDLLAELLGRGHGLEWALMAYNGGPSYANKMTAANKVSKYVHDVLNYMNVLGGN